MQVELSDAEMEKIDGILATFEVRGERYPAQFAMNT